MKAETWRDIKIDIRKKGKTTEPGLTITPTQPIEGIPGARMSLGLIEPGFQDCEKEEVCVFTNINIDSYEGESEKIEATGQFIANQAISPYIREDLAPLLDSYFQCEYFSYDEDGRLGLKITDLEADTIEEMIQDLSQSNMILFSADTSGSFEKRNRVRKIGDALEE